MVRFDNLRTVRQIVEASREASGGQHPAITEGSLRWLIFRADQNGLDEAIVRVGRRVLIDIEAFNRWLERGDAGQPRDERLVERHSFWGS